jgi:PIN domain nuclease of toxin-antitoxin system
VKLLLDTHAFLWFAAGDRRLGRVARKELERAGSELYISAVSIWEMAIKSSLKRLTLPGPVKMALVTRDKVFRRYGVQLVW